MKRKILAIALSLMMVATCAISLSTTANAEPGSGSWATSGSGIVTGTSPNATATYDGAPQTTNEIEVQASVVGGGEIIYKITVAWKDMKFQYSYGDTWDPENHVYTGGDTGWNVADYVKDTNNKITITNHSNFPVTADLTYAHNPTTVFNSNPSAPNAVKGMFNTNNTNLANDVKNTKTTSGSDIDITVDLNMDKSHLLTDKTYYYKTADDGIYIKDVFFSLWGIPDNNIALTSEFTTVGNITVAVAPATDCTSAIVP